MHLSSLAVSLRDRACRTIEFCQQSIQGQQLTARVQNCRAAGDGMSGKRNIGRDLPG